MNDEKLVMLAQQGSDQHMESLLVKYKSLVRTVTRAYFLTGADGEDLLQEGMIGLYKAILSFVPGKNVNFGKYAEICIKRQVISAVKYANRLKHLPLNSYVSIYKENDDDCDMDCLTTSDLSNPEEIAISKESTEIFKQKIDTLLSDFEKQVLIMFLNGDSYASIAGTLNKDPKAIDNALQRVKRKLKNA